MESKLAVLMGDDFIVEKRDVGNSLCQHIYVKRK